QGYVSRDVPRAGCGVCGPPDCRKPVRPTQWVRHWRRHRVPRPRRVPPGLRRRAGGPGANLAVTLRVDNGEILAAARLGVVYAVAVQGAFPGTFGDVAQRAVHREAIGRPRASRGPRACDAG